MILAAIQPMSPAKQHVVLLLLFSMLQMQLAQFDYLIGPSSYLDIVKTSLGTAINRTDRNQAYCTTTGSGSRLCMAGAGNNTRGSNDFAVTGPQLEQLQLTGRSPIASERYAKPYNVCTHTYELTALLPFARGKVHIHLK